MKLERLGNIIEITKGKKATNVGNQSATYKHRYIQIEDLRHNENLKYTNESNLVDVNSDDVIIAWDGANAGTVGYDLNGIIGSTLARLRVKNPNKINPFYLGLFLQSQFKFFSDRTTGATIPHIERDSLENIKVPIVSIEKQRQIVSVLDKAQAIIDKRKNSLQLLDQLLKDVFLDMFGDPAKNFKKLSAVTLSNLIIDGDRINYGIVQPGDDFPNGVPIIRVGDIKDLKINKSNLKKVDPKIDKSYPRSRLIGDEILIACVGATLGKVALCDETMRNYNIVRATARVRINPNKINRYYLALYLSSSYIQSFFISETRTVSQPTLNISQIEETPILVPPIDLQNQFGQFFLEIEKLKNKILDSLSQSETLFQSLLQNAFKGELEIHEIVEEVSALDMSLPEDLVVRKPLELKQKVSLEEVPSAEKPQVAEPNLDYIATLKDDFITVDGRNIYLTQFVKEQGLVNFTLATLSRRFQEVLGATILRQQLSESVYSVIDHFLIAELLNQPFTFQQLKSVLAGIGFKPSFDILNEYIFNRMEGANPLLKQAYFDEHMSKVNAEAYQYLLDAMNPNLVGQDAFTPPRRLFLVSGFPAIKMPHAT